MSYLKPGLDKVVTIAKHVCDGALKRILTLHLMILIATISCERLILATKPYFDSSKT